MIKEPLMPCEWSEYQLFFGPENAGKVIHPSLDIAQFEYLDSGPLPTTQLHCLAGRQLSLTSRANRFVNSSGCFAAAESKFANFLTETALGQTMKQIERQVGAPADRTGPDDAFENCFITEYWLYYLGYSRQAVLLGFEKGICRSAKILSEEESREASWRRVKLMMSFGMPEKEFLRLAGPPQAVLHDQFSRTIYRYKIGQYPATVDIPVKNGKVCKWRGMNCLMGWGASCEQFY